MTYETYKTACEVIDSTRQRAMEIAGALQPGCSISIDRFDSDSVFFTHTFRNSDDADCFPAEWLFDADWELRVRDEHSHRKLVEAERQKRQAEHWEAEERKKYESLKAKYAT